MNSDPASVRLDVAGNLLAIRWGDGHESRYDGAYLRWICPCA
ncbi:MAG: gamma-butyrobetaine hydroxylase-like domain-containing protein, partial [Planctomycetota bacterium]